MELSHGKFRMIDELRRELGNKLQPIDYQMLEQQPHYMVKRIFETTFTTAEIFSFEKKWAKENILKKRTR